MNKSTMTTATKIQKANPNYVTAQSALCLNQRLQKENAVLQKTYFEVLDLIKMHYAGEEVECFERDYTVYPDGNPRAIHCYISAKVYWYLICDDCDVFYIFCQFNDDELREKVNGVCAALSVYENIVAMHPLDLTLAFERCKKAEPSQFFHI